MTALKGIAEKIVLSLPLAALALFAFDLPFPVPGALVPPAEYAVLRKGPAAERYLASLPARHAASLVLADAIVPLPASPDERAKAAGALPAVPVPDLLIEDLDRLSVRSARVVVDGPLPARFRSALAAFAKRKGVRISTRMAGGTYAPASARFPVQAYRILPSSTGKGAEVEILFSPEAAGALDWTVRDRGSAVYSREALSFPADRLARVAAFPGSALSVEARYPDATVTTRIRPAIRQEDDPRVLFVTSRPALSSAVERLYPVKKISPDELGKADPFAYELVVIDGIPLASIPGAASETLRAYAERNSGTLAVIADSPEFGRPGDNPALEAVLPVELAPRSLKRLPDVAMLVLLDVSGSMFGDKLSLAKVTGVEALGNLKDSDLVGLITFHERFSWLYRFERAGDVQARTDLEPVNAQGGTRLYPALARGLEELARAPRETKHAVVISDGLTEPGDFPGLMAKARSMGASISVMAVGEEYDRELLSSLATGTGGKFYRVTSPDEIPSLLLEDRKNISRTLFYEADIPVFAVSGAQVARIGGMARLSPRPGSISFLANEDGDPLLVSRDRGARGVILFASDIYGSYTEGFFRNREALGVFRARLDAAFSDYRPEISLSAHALGVTFTVLGRYLMDPRYAVTGGNGAIVAEGSLDRGPEGWFSAEFEPPEEGDFTLVVFDRGVATARFPFAFAASLSGLPSDAFMPGEGIPSPPFIPFPARPAWLLAFFALSLVATVWLRGNP